MPVIFKLQKKKDAHSVALPQSRQTFGSAFRFRTPFSAPLYAPYLNKKHRICRPRTNVRQFDQHFVCSDRNAHFADFAELIPNFRLFGNRMSDGDQRVFLSLYGRIYKRYGMYFSRCNSKVRS